MIGKGYKMKIFKKVKKSNGRRQIYFCGIKVFSCKNKNKSFSNYTNTSIDASAFIDGSCEIGEYTFIGKDVDITKAKIGRYCSIAPHVRIGQGEHDINEISTSSKLSDRGTYDDLTTKPCEIKNDVWIGTESIIRRGVVIGNGAVIGANSFVNKDVPDFAVVAGSPAKIIKYRFSPEMRQKIKESEYWNYSPEEAKKILKRLQKENFAK